MKDINRYLLSVEIYDNQKEKTIVSEGFNTNSKDIIVRKLEEIIAKLTSN